MFSTLDQENLTHAHFTTAANKPLNQNIRALQPKTPGPVSKTPFRPRNDENAPLNTGKAGKNAFVTPGPAPQTTKRAPLGAKTTNAKAAAFQTPAPGQQLKHPDQTAKKPSSTARRSIKRKIHIEPEAIAAPADLQVEEEDEPDFGYAPPPIIPLPDPPIDFEGISYDALKPENFNRGIAEFYFQSPKDENGLSIALKKQEELHKKSLEHDLAHLLEEPTRQDPDEPAAAIISTGLIKPKPIQESKVSTLKARSASAALSEPSAPRTHAHQRLPSAVTRETAASKQKRKSTFAVSRDEIAATSTMPMPISRSTIGFPKAKKPASILPQIEKQRSYEGAGVASASTIHAAQNQSENRSEQSTISPRKFVQLYGEPPLESEMWFRLMELEVRDRHRGEDREQEQDQGIFDVDLDDDLDQRLGVNFGLPDEDEFELTL